MSIPDLLGLLVEGGWITLLATVCVGLIALPLSFAVGVARSFSRVKTFRAILGLYVEVFRGTSAIVQLFWAFFVLPAVGIELTPFVAGVIVLGLNAGAYGSEIVRGAIRAVPAGQVEASEATNLNRFDTVRYVILPQAVPIAIPPLESLAIEWFKATSLLSLISVTDLTYTVNTLAINGRLGFIPSYLVLLCAYLILSVPLSAAARAVDSKFGRQWRRASESPEVSRLDAPVAL